jgi:hypothetical protein
MNERTVEEVYATNAAIREKLVALIGSLDDAKLNQVSDGEKWSPADIVEHLSMVEGSAIRICAKLLGKAEKEGRNGDGMIRITNSFFEKGNEIAKAKLEAPEFVQPSGNRPVEESFEAMRENSEKLDELKPRFNDYDTTDFTFPHPYFGGLSAGEWLTLIGAHEARHIRQIRAIIEK